MAKLLGYDHEIIYRPGRENLAADALSQVPESPILNALSVPHVSLWEDIKKASREHPYMDRIAQQTQSNMRKPYTWRDGLVFFKTQVVVPPNIAVVDQLLQEFHDTKMGGHSGILGTFKRLSKQFYWPFMHRSVKDYVQAYVTWNFD